MQRLSTELIGQACRIFLELAYPAGEATIPASQRELLRLPAQQSIFDCVGASGLQTCCQVVRSKSGEASALLIRLGSEHYPNLKLKTQLVEGNSALGWVFSVDTHDAFSSNSLLPPPEHPDALKWRAMQAANVALKEKVEAAWERVGLLTFNGLLRRGLPKTGLSNT